MTSLFVKPAVDGAQIPNPDRMFTTLAADGENVPDNSFWRRRLAAGDVVEATPQDIEPLPAPIIAPPASVPESDPKAGQ